MCTCREECNKWDLTADPYFWFVNHNDWSRWFALSSSHLFALPRSVLWVGLEKSKQLNLDVTNIFAESHTQHPVGMLELPISPHYVFICSLGLGQAQVMKSPTPRALPYMKAEWLLLLKELWLWNLLWFGVEPKSWMVGRGGGGVTEE
jgi:hypothetical protein